MATTKKTEELAPISNINNNNNTNNVNVNVKLEPPRAKRTPKKEVAPKPNWIVKAITLGIIALALSLIGYYVKNSLSGQKLNPSMQAH